MKVEPKVLRNTAQQVTGLARSLQNDFSEMQTVVERTRYYWVGAAADRYRKEFASQKQETQELLALLGKYPQDLLSMAQIYEDVESRNTQATQALPSDIL